MIGRLFTKLNITLAWLLGASEGETPEQRPSTILVWTVILVATGIGLLVFDQIYVALRYR